jgi:signal transduction histidine kinase
MIRKKITVIFFACYLLAIFLNASNDIIKFENTTKSSLIGKNIYILKDPGNTLDINQVQAISGFEKSISDVPNLGVSSSTYWIKFSIQNLSTEENLLLEFSQPFTNDVILFSPNGEKFDVQVSGDNYPFSIRQYQYSNFVFDIKLKFNETKTFFLKVKSDEQILIPLKIGTSKTIINGLHNLDVIFGIYAGIIIVMLFYNLFIYFSIKDPIYLKYVVYIFFIGFTQASILGYPFEYIWPNWPYFANLSIYMFSCGVGISALEFLKPFLKTKEFTPKLHKFSYLITGLYTLTGILSLLGFMHIGYLMVQGCAVLVAVYMLIVAIVIFKKGFRPAYFFLVAWSAMLVGIIIFVFKDFGVFPTNMLTSYTMPIGSALETVLLSFALADRINILKKEKEESQVTTLLALQENEKLIIGQKYELEKEVLARTAELEKSNGSLSSAITHLKDAQSQLVNAEKMASLGQLTAGIAHEINNPINFVSANVKPLKMDIAEILDIIKKYESITPQDKLEDKLKEIDAFKQEIDFIYLKQEIEKLLTGIEDGAKRTAEIISGLKNFARLDESETKVANINDGIKSTLVLLKSSIPPDVQVTLNLEDVPIIECLPGKLNQVFMNILNNALQAVMKKKPGEEKKIIISTYVLGEQIFASFEDTGIGMKPEVQAKVFEPFFTTKDVGEGTGLGMSIVFKIIENHGANIIIDSEYGKGTTIKLALNKKIKLPA